MKKGKIRRPLSYSSIKEFMKSPNHLLSYWDREKVTTPAMLKGTLIHTLLLEPEKMEKEYATWLGGRRAGNEYKTFQEENQGKTIIKPEELEEAEKIIKTAKNNVLLNLKKGVELEILWKMNLIPFRGFVDFYGAGFIGDVKTCSDASPKAFQRDFIKFKYYIQAFLYGHANETLRFAGENPDYFILAVETSPPYNSQMYKVSTEFIEKGKEEVHKALQDFEKWDGEPAGYEFYDLLEENGVITLNLPEWMQ